MPRSPRSILLLVLTLGTFAAQLVWSNEPGWLPGVLMACSVILILGTTASIVRDGAALDDRAFHRTRPGGESRAFRNAILVFLVLIAVRALMGGISLWMYNFGGPPFGFFVAAVVLPLWFCMAACAAALTLAFSGESRTFRLAALLLVPPFVVDQWIKGRGGFQWLPLYDHSLFLGASWMALAGAVGYSLAWWLAAARKRRRVALVLACATGALLPLVRGLGSLPYPERPPLPEAGGVKITRLAVQGEDPLEAKVRRYFREDHAKRAQASKEYAERYPRYVPIFLKGRLKVEGLREDEFLHVYTLLGSNGRRGNLAPLELVTGVVTPEGRGHQRGYRGLSFVMRGRDPQPASGGRALEEYLASRLPAPAKLADDSAIGAEPFDWIDVDEKRSSVTALEARTWPIAGMVYRIEDAGSFDLATGGSGRLPSGGMVRVPPYKGSGPVEIAIMGVTDFDWGSVPLGATLDLGVMVLLHDPVTGVVRVPDRPDRVENHGAWDRYELSVGVDGDGHFLSEEEHASFLRSRIYLFRPRPVGRVSAALPPP